MACVGNCLLRFCLKWNLKILMNYVNVEDITNFTWFCYMFQWFEKMWVQVNCEKVKRECWWGERKRNKFFWASLSSQIQHQLLSIMSSQAACLVSLLYPRETKITTSKQKYKIVISKLLLVSLDFQTLLIYYNICFYVPFTSSPDCTVNAFCRKRHESQYLVWSSFCVLVCFLELKPLHATLVTPSVITFLPEIKRSKGYVSSPWYL